METCPSPGDLSLGGKGQMDELEEERTDLEQKNMVEMEKRNFTVKG